jgi:hypothetical protein
MKAHPGVRPGPVPWFLRAAGAAILGGLLACRAALPPIETGATVVRSGILGALPKESVGLVVVEIGSLRALAPFERFLTELTAAVEEEGPLRSLRARLGDPTLERISRLALAVAPRPGGPGNAVGYAVLAEGRQSEAEARAILGGAEVLSIEAATEGRPEVILGVLPGGTIVFGPRPVVDLVQSNAARRGDGLDANATMMTLLAKVQPTSHFWGAVDFRTMARLGRQASGARAPAVPLAGGTLASSLVAFGFQGKAGAAVEVDLFGRADDAAGARTIVDTTRGLIRIGQIGATPDQAKDWIAFLNSITVQQKEAEISLHATIPDAMLVSLTQKARAAAAEIPGGGKGTGTPARPAATRTPSGAAATRTPSGPAPTATPRAGAPHP